MVQVVNLFRLQKVDTRRDQITARLAEIARIISQDRTLIDAQTALDVAAGALKQAQKTLKATEESVQSQQIKIEETEASLYGGRIRSPKELQDLQAESAALKRHLAVLEDHQIEAMLAHESAETAHADAEKRFRQAQGDAATRIASLVGERGTLERELARLDSERKAIADAIPAEDRAYYDRLRQTKRGLALATVADESCEACGSSLTPAEIQSARAPGRITLCPSCGRILYAG